MPRDDNTRFFYERKSVLPFPDQPGLVPSI